MKCRNGKKTLPKENYENLTRETARKINRKEIKCGVLSDHHEKIFIGFQVLIMQMMMECIPGKLS